MLEGKLWLQWWRCFLRSWNRRFPMTCFTNYQRALGDEKTRKCSIPSGAYYEDPADASGGFSEKGHDVLWWRQKGVKSNLRCEIKTLSKPDSCIWFVNISAAAGGFYCSLKALRGFLTFYIKVQLINQCSYFDNWLFVIFKSSIFYFQVLKSQNIQILLFFYDSKLKIFGDILMKQLEL